MKIRTTSKRVFGINSLTLGFKVDQAFLDRLVPICLTNRVRTVEFVFPALNLRHADTAINIFASRAQAETNSVCMFFGKDMPDPLNPNQTKEALNLLVEAMDFAVAIGATIVAGPIGFSIGQPGTREDVCNFLKLAIPKARKRKITLCLEPLRPTENLALPGGFDDAIWVVNQIGSCWLRVLVDTFHGHCLGEEPEVTLKRVGKLVGHIHLSGSERMTPGLDQINWASVARGLDAINYQGDLVLELFGPGCRQEIPNIVDRGFPSSLSTNTSVEVTRFVLEEYGIIEIEKERP